MTTTPTPAPTPTAPPRRLLKALSIRQPWAWLILHQGKDIENRSWRTHYTGPILIHASASRSAEADHYEALAFLESSPALAAVADALRSLDGPLPTGGIVGRVEIVGCQSNVAACERPGCSPWTGGAEWGFRLAHPEPLPFQPCRGMLGFFTPRLAEADLTDRFFA